MNKHWRKVKLGKLININPDAIDGNYEFSEIEYIDISSVGSGELLGTTKYQLNEAPGRARRLVKDGDTIISTVRPNRRSFLCIKDPPPNVVVSTGFAVLRANNDIDPRYLYYYVTNQRFTDYLSNHAKGSAYPAIDTNTIEKAEIDLPDIIAQRRIAAILSAYDDLIENNNRRIKILEQMAQTIYREWFVDFRFPGHEKVKMVNSKLGKIPEGWEVRSFTDCIDVLSGGTPKTTVSEYWGGEIPFFTPKDSTQYPYVIDTERHITGKGLNDCNSKLYPKETVFITARGTVGNIALAGKDMAMSQSCYALVGKDKLSQLLVYFTSVNQLNYLKKNTGGATFDTIIVDTFKRMNIISPAKEVVGVFHQHIEALMNEILNILNTNRGLIRTRDLLLPKLVGGEVEV